MSDNFIKDGECPFCQSKKFDPTTMSTTSEVKCDACGAIFESPRLLDGNKAGKFTGRYGEISRKSLNNYGFHK